MQEVSKEHVQVMCGSSIIKRKKNVQMKNWKKEGFVKGKVCVVIKCHGIVHDIYLHDEAEAIYVGVKTLKVKYKNNIFVFTLSKTLNTSLYDSISVYKNYQDYRDFKNEVDRVINFRKLIENELKKVINSDTLEQIYNNLLKIKK